MSDFIARSVTSERTRWWWSCSVVIAVTLLATTTSSSGEVVADNRFDALVSAGGRFWSAFGLWDRTRGLGDVREDVWPITTIPVWVLESLGLPLWIVQRMWHAGCLSAAAIGTMAVFRFFRPKVDSAHLAAGLLVAVGPFSLTFLIPSNLYLMFAVGPWLLLAVLRGVHEDAWRWAACFALLIAGCGNPDLPGLVYGLVAVVPALWYVVDVERSTTWRRVSTFVLKATLLSVPANALMLTKTVLAGRRLTGRLAETESPAVGALTSSWSESVRGLGNWLSYFRTSAGFVKPQGTVYLTDWIVVLATFVAPIVALSALWLSSWRPRLLIASMMTLSLVLVVGGFGASDSPIASMLLGGFMEVPALGAYRNTYKAAGGLVIGGSILAAVGYASVRSRGRLHWPRAAWTIDLVAVGVLFAVSVPAWTGSLYHPDRSYVEIPGYWTGAFAALDGISAPGRVVVIPAVSQVPYRWGTVGDDLFDGLLARPRAIATGVPAAGPLGADSIEALAMLAQYPGARPGEFAAIARRLGVTEVVIRNDVDWQAARVARPSAFAHLRSDPSLELIGTYGLPGEHVVAHDDTSNHAALERRLPPVEIYRILGSIGGTRVHGADSITVLSGAAASWSGAIAGGVVPGGGPLLVAGASSDRQVAEVLDRGGQIVLTDTPRRRVRSLVAFEPRSSATLGDGQVLERPVRSLFPIPGTEAVAWYRDAVEISGSTTRDVGATAHRPAHAFDGDPTTAWSVPRLTAGGSATLAVRFREIRNIEVVEIDALVGAGLSTVRSGWLSLSDGHTVPFTVPEDGSVRIEVGGVPTTSLRLSFRSFADDAGRVGVAGIRIDQLDLREYVEVPDELTRRSVVASRVGSTPISYSFERVVSPTWFVTTGTPADELAEEQRIDRRFHVPSPREFEVVVSASFRGGADRSVLDAIRAAASTGACVDVGARLVRPDGTVTPVRLRADTASDRLPDAASFEMTGCAIVRLDEGWHLLESGEGGLIDRWALLDMSRPARVADPVRPAEVVASSAATVRFESPSEPAVVVVPTTFDRGWSLHIGQGETLPPLPLDGMNGWYVPDASSKVVTARFGSERIVDAAAVVAGIAVVICVLVIGVSWRRSRRLAARVEGAREPESRDGDVELDELFVWFDDWQAQRADHEDGTQRQVVDGFDLSADDDDRAVGPGTVVNAADVEQPRRPGIAAMVVGGVLAVALVGPLGVVVALVAVAVDRLGERINRPLLGLIPVVLLVAAAGTMLAEGTLGPGDAPLRFARTHHWPHQLTITAFSFVVVFLALMWSRERRASPDASSSPADAKVGSDTAAQAEW